MNFLVKGLRTMATPFYVLPSRDALGQRYGELLSAIFPETRVTPWDWPELAASLEATVDQLADACVVYREDLDERMSVKDALLANFGASLDDDIVEVTIGPGLHQIIHQRWANDKLRTAA